MSKTGDMAYEIGRLADMMETTLKDNGVTVPTDDLAGQLLEDIAEWLFEQKGTDARDLAVLVSGYRDGCE